MGDVQAVTGPFSYTGKYIAERLAAKGGSVRGFVRTVPTGRAKSIAATLQFANPTGSLRT